MMAEARRLFFAGPVETRASAPIKAASARLPHTGAVKIANKLANQIADHVHRSRIMSPQETQTLQQFLTQLVQVRGIVRDPQADAMIVGAVARQPDATYLLVQRALLMEQALNRANEQIAALQNQLQATQQAPARGFLDAETWGSPAAQRQQPMPQPMM